MKKGTVTIVGPDGKFHSYDRDNGAWDGKVPEPFWERSIRIKKFVNDVIPTKGVANASSRADIVRIISNTPIVWEDQEFCQGEVVDYLWHHKAEYQEDAE